MADVNNGPTSTLASFSPYVAAAAQVGSSAIAYSGSRKNVKTQIQAQKESEADARAFNSAEAQKARDWQYMMEQSYRKYNSLSSQAKRAQEAGLHPTSILGNVQPSDFGITSSPVAHSSSGMSPVGFTPLDTSAAMRNLAEARVLDTQADKNEAEANETNKLVDGKMALQRVKIDLGKAQTHMTEEQATMFASTASKMNKTVEYIDGLLGRLKYETNSAKWQSLRDALDYQFKYQTSRSSIDALNAENDYKTSAFQFKKDVAMWTYELLNLKADTSSKLSRAFFDSEMGKFYRDHMSNLVDAQEDEADMRGYFYEQSGLKFSYENKELKIWTDWIEDHPDYVSTMRIADDCLDKVGSIVDALNPIANIKNAFKPAMRKSSSANFNYNTDRTNPSSKRKSAPPKTFSIRR